MTKNGLTKWLLICALALELATRQICLPVIDSLAPDSSEHLVQNFLLVVVKCILCTQDSS